MNCDGRSIGELHINGITSSMDEARREVSATASIIAGDDTIQCLSADGLTATVAQSSQETGECGYLEIRALPFDETLLLEEQGSVSLP